MISEHSRFLSVNWVDGMSINKKHFIDQSHFHIQQNMDMYRLLCGPYAYGLIPSTAPNPQSVQLNFIVDNNIQLTAKLNHLSAITPGGAFIDINDNSSGEVELSSPLPDQASEGSVYQVVLTANPFKAQTMGLANPDETPPRKPYVTPLYRLNLIELNDAIDREIGLYELVIGQLTYDGSTWEVDPNYIPPCYSIQAHIKLRERFKEAQAHLSLIEQHSIQIIQKVRSKHQDNTLALAISFICQQILPLIGANLSTFRQFAAHQPPSKIIESAGSLARVFKNALDSWQGHGKDELMTYLSEWCNINQATLDNALHNLIVLEYKHTNIAPALYSAIYLLEKISAILPVLTGLDFIGERIETDLFVKEEMEEEEIVGTTERKKGFLKMKW